MQTTTNQRRGRWLLLFLCGMGLMLMSCHHDEVDYFPQPDTDARLTVFMFIPYVPSLRAALDQNLKDIRQTIVAGKGLHGARLVVYRATSESEGTLTELRYGAQTDSCYVATLKNYSNFTPTQAETLATLLGDVRQLAPSSASQYAMLIGCHGMGWIPADSWYATRFFGGDNLASSIEIATLAAAIKSAGMKMQYVMFDDCYMACVEVAYELREVTDYLVGSTCEIMAYGLPYATMLPLLLSPAPDYDALMFQFHRFYSTYVPPCGTFSAIDCREVAATAAMMQAINARYTFDEAQRPALQSYDGLSPHIFYDLGEYARLLCGNDDAVYTAFSRQLERLVPSKTTTTHYYSVYDGQQTPIRAYSGIAVSDPSVSGRVSASLHHTAWWQATH